MILTKTLDLKNHTIHLDMRLPDYFTSKKVKITIEPEDDFKKENPIKNLRGKLLLSDIQYNEIQNFLNEDR